MPHGLTDHECLAKEIRLAKGRWENDPLFDGEKGADKVRYSLVLPHSGVYWRVSQPIFALLQSQLQVGLYESVDGEAVFDPLWFSSHIDMSRAIEFAITQFEYPEPHD